jgi:hypothetical protein
VTQILRSYILCRFSIPMTFGHRLACNYANFLISMSSTFFSNPCHFLKDPFWADTAQRGDRRHRTQPIVAFRHMTPPTE